MLELFRGIGQTYKKPHLLSQAHRQEDKLRNGYNTNADSPRAQAARSALLASLTAAGLLPQQAGIPMYPPPQFDSGNLTPQALSRVEEHMLPIGAQQLQQQPQAATQLQPSAPGITSSEALPSQLPLVQPVPPHPSGSDSEDDARRGNTAANGDRKSQLKEKNRKAQKRFRERQRVSYSVQPYYVDHHFPAASHLMLSS